MKKCGLEYTLTGNRMNITKLLIFGCSWVTKTEIPLVQTKCILTGWLLIYKKYYKKSQREKGLE